MQKNTPEQQKQIDGLSRKYFFLGIFNGFHHAAMLIMINMIIYAAMTLIKASESASIILSLFAAFFILKRMHSTVDESHDRFTQEVKKITEK